MALLPMGPPSTSYRNDHDGYSAGDAQETMFDEPAGVAAPETAETDYEEIDETRAENFFEPDEVFADEIPELISYQAGTGQRGIDPIADAELDPESKPESKPAIALEPTPEVPAQLSASAEVEEPRQDSTGPIAENTAEPASPNMLTSNDFAALEDRVLRAVTLVRSERQARVAAEERAAAMEAQLHSFEAQIQQIEAQSPILERLVQEVESLRMEREQVRQRVERLLGQLDALEL